MIGKSVKITKITVHGNTHLSSAKIKEYINLQKGQIYSENDISHAILRAYNSNLFTIIYPTLIQKPNGTELVIHVKERDRNHLAMSFHIREDNQISGSLTYEMINTLQPNSKFLINGQFGAKKEINLDYVKNFGKHFGVYFHLYPYLKESTLNIYNTEHNKINNVTTFESGATYGIGLFVKRGFVSEIYSFAYQIENYNAINELENDEYKSMGFGLKFYHESIDNVIFPMKGLQGFYKLSVGKKLFGKDDWHRKFFTKLRYLIPIGDFTLENRLEYGSYFKKRDANKYDPFYIGGLDSFLGLNRREMSAPIYRILSLKLRKRMIKDLYIDMVFNTLNLGNTDTWEFERQNIKMGGGFVLGYDSFVGPLRIGIGINDAWQKFYYFSVGYDFDPFMFSRK